MDLFDYMREQNMEKRGPAGIQTAPDHIRGSSRTTAHYRKGQITLQGDQG